MTTWLKQNTAVQVGLGPFLDETDGKTAETALVITQPDIRLKKNGAAWAQINAAGTLTHEENGWYEIPLDATDTNTLGELVVAVHEAGALPCWRTFQVVPANAYDSLVAGSASLTADAAGVRAAVGLAGANLDTQLAAIAGFIDTEVAAILAAVDTEVAAIKLKTDNLPAAPAAVSDIPTAAQNATQLLDVAAGVETGMTVRQALRVCVGALAGKLSGAATTTVAIRNVADSKDRILATVDANGNRSAIVFDLT